MKKLNKKGFTIIELVIVIAVIAILAAVLIPTFANVVEKAHQSSAMQTASSFYQEVIALDLADGVQDGKEGNTAITFESINDKPAKLTDMQYSAENGVVNFKAIVNKYTVERQSDGSFKVTKGESDKFSA